MAGNSDKQQKPPRFARRKKGGQVWWVDEGDSIGILEFSFDRRKIYNLFADYPHNLTPEEIEIFDSENPYWMEFFKDRK